LRERLERERRRRQRAEAELQRQQWDEWQRDNDYRRELEFAARERQRLPMKTQNAIARIMPSASAWKQSVFNLNNNVLELEEQRQEAEARHLAELQATAEALRLERENLAQERLRLQAEREATDRRAEQAAQEQAARDELERVRAETAALRRARLAQEAKKPRLATGAPSASRGTLYSASSTRLWLSLRRNATGNAVSSLQHVLRARGVQSVRVTGRFDAATERALKAFQRSQRLSVTGSHR
jgi:hypothetical protein